MKNITIQNKAILKAEGKLNSNHCKPVVCIKVDGSEFRIFSSVADAAETLVINANYISTCMNDKTPCKGWMFRDARDIASFICEMGDVINNTARDAQKWREQEAEKERIRLEKEKYEADLEKAKAKVARRTEICEHLADKLAKAERRKMDAEMDLEALLDQNQPEVA